MDKKLPLLLVLCFLWIVIVQQVLFKPVPKPGAADRGKEDALHAGKEPGPEGGKRTEAETSGSPPPRAGVREKAGGGTPEGVKGDFPATGDVPAEEIPVETSEFLVRLSNRGAVVKEIRFKKYFNDPDTLLDEEKQKDPANWLDILREVHRGEPSFALREAGKARYFLDTVCWEWERTREGKGTGIRFTYRTRDGLVFRKTYAFHAGAYHLDLSLEVENRNPALEEKSLSFLLEGPCGITDRKRASFTQGPMGVLDCYTGEGNLHNRKLEQLKPGKLKDLRKTGYEWIPRGEEQLGFAGVTNNYFALLVKPEEQKWLRVVRFFPLEDSEKVDAAVEAARLHGRMPPGGAALEKIREDALVNVKTEFEFHISAPAPGKRARQGFLFFAGPKLTDLMERPPYRDFYALIEESYGSMAWINKSLIWILKLFHSLFGNWGAAIIGLTLVIKGLLLPLNRVQQVSMREYSEKMKRLKPKLEELKKKYKNNKKKFNEAQMRLMKEEGVRPPLMGCLLIFFQFPVFIGLFQILRTSFELRHSPFCLWVKDLSQPDALPLPFALPLVGNHINVLPIAMTVAFYYQQKLMPKPDTADPQAAQMQKIMRFMPIIFGFMFYGYASGLSLYWMTSNLISILEYRFIRKKFERASAGAKAGGA